ncbi:MAG: hypothetical protein ABR573_03535 [Candidatus Dormibacteria bacterium]
MAAAIQEALALTAVIVGGTAEVYWSGDEYHQTDLDLCASIGPEHHAALRAVGFVRSGRHWEHVASGVAVEFPESEIDGDPARTRTLVMGSGFATVIGVEDLYVDRVRQATADDNEYGRFQSALAIAAAQYERIDWKYVQRRLRDVLVSDPTVGVACRAIDSRIRRRVRRILTS